MKCLGLKIGLLLDNRYKKMERQLGCFFLVLTNVEMDTSKSDDGCAESIYTIRLIVHVSIHKKI